MRCTIGGRGSGSVSPPSERASRDTERRSRKGSLPSILFGSASPGGSLPSILFDSASPKGSLPSILFDSASPKGSLPSILFDSASPGGSLPSIRFGSASPKGSLPSIVFGSASPQGSRPSIVFGSVSPQGSRPSIVFGSVSRPFLGLRPSRVGLRARRLRYVTRNVTGSLQSPRTFRASVRYRKKYRVPGVSPVTTVLATFVSWRSSHSLASSERCHL